MIRIDAGWWDTFSPYSKQDGARSLRIHSMDSPVDRTVFAVEQIREVGGLQHSGEQVSVEGLIAPSSIFHILLLYQRVFFAQFYIDRGP